MLTSFAVHGAASTPITNLLAAAGFLVLFPVFYAYHFAAGQGYISPFLGGLFGATALTLFAPMLLSHLRLHHHGPGRVLRASAVLWTFYLTVVFAMFWTGLNIALEASVSPASKEILRTLVLWAVLFHIGLTVPLMIRRRFRTVIWLLWMAMILIALTGANGRYLMVYSEGVEGVATYQGLGRSMMVMSCAVVAMSRGLMLRMTVALIGIVGLFVTGARSELYGFIAGYAAMEALISIRHPGRAIGFITAFFGVGVLIAANLDALSVSRQLQVLDLQHASSWLERQNLTSIAMQQISESPLLGVYGGHWEVGEGYYAHNALSAWVSFGLVGFVLYVGLNTLAALKATELMVCIPNNPMARLAFMVAFSSLLLIAVAKEIFWVTQAFGWGLVVSASLYHRLSAGHYGARAVGRR